MVMFLISFRPRSRAGSNHRNNDPLHLYCVDFGGLAVVRPIGGKERWSCARPAIFPCRARSARRNLIAIGAGPGAGAVVLHRAVPASRGSSRRRNGVDGGERQGESQSDLGQHDLSPRMGNQEWLLQRGNGQVRQPLLRACGDWRSFAPIDAREAMRSRQRPRSLKEA